MAIRAIPRRLPCSRKSAKQRAPLLSISSIWREATVGGTLGRYGIAAGDELMRQVGLADRTQEVARTPAEHPLWGAFLSPRPTGTRAQSTQDFFELLGRSKKAKATIEDLIEEGDLDAARRLADQYPEDSGYPDLSAIQSQISDLIQARKIVQGSRELTPDEKREKIDRLNDLIRDLAERGSQVGS